MEIFMKSTIKTISMATLLLTAGVVFAQQSNVNVHGATHGQAGGVVT